MPFTEHAASLCLLTSAFSSFPIETAVLSSLPQTSKKGSIVGRGLHSASKINVGVKRDIQIHVKVRISVRKFKSQNQSGVAIVCLERASGKHSTEIYSNCMERDRWVRKKAVPSSTQPFLSRQGNLGKNPTTSQNQTDLLQLCSSEGAGQLLQMSIATSLPSYCPERSLVVFLGQPCPTFRSMLYA